jgi:microcystin-dependent protein
LKQYVLAGVLSAFSVVGVTGIMNPTRTTDDSLPVGTIIAWGGQTDSIPKNWIICNGRAMKKTAFKDLFAALDYSWGGSGDTFYLPDLRGRFLRGLDTGAGRDPDVKNRKPSKPGGSATGVGSVQEDSLQNHSHEQNPHNHQFYYPGTDALVASGVNYQVAQATVVSYHTTSDSVEIMGARRYKTNAAIKTGEESRPKNAAVHYIIKVR